MATAYVAVEWMLDETGERKNFGDPVEVATTNPAEQANYDRLVDYGVLSPDPPQRPVRAEGGQ